MKIFFRRIHLYLGLISGAVIMVICFTGALLVFQKELEQTFHKHRYFVTPSGKRISLEEMGSLVQNKFPLSKLNSIKVYSDPTRSAEVNIALPAKEKTGHQETSNPKSEGTQKKPQGEGRSPGLTVFVHPYNGQILEVYNVRESFFFKVMALHRWLTGNNNSIGKYVTGISTLIFLFILITGIILWWPRNKRMLLQRLTLKKSAGWKRKNHDLHIVLGFYSSIFLLIVAFTALPMSFEWANKGLFQLAGSPMKPPVPAQSIYQDSSKRVTADEVLSTANAVLPDVQFYTVVWPKDSISTFTINALSNHPVHESATDALYVDQYSGKMTGHQFYNERSRGAKIRSTFRPIHVGSIGGLTTKIIAVIICLLGTSFPVTGVILWLNRTVRTSSKRMAPQTRIQEV